MLLLLITGLTFIIPIFIIIQKYNYEILSPVHTGTQSWFLQTA